MFCSFECAVARKIPFAKYIMVYSHIIHTFIFIYIFYIVMHIIVTYIHT